MKKLDLKTPNFTKKNIAKLAEIFPNCVTEINGEDGVAKYAIELDLLRQEISDTVVEGPVERYGLSWPGKREALVKANTPISKTLRPCWEESVDPKTTKNIFIEGDNLDALKLLQESYLGKVEMIYIDPPYNTGNDFVYSDDFTADKVEHEVASGERNEEGGRLVHNPDSNGRFHSDWLSMLYPRLKLARNLMNENGVIFISIDDNEIANLIRICDEVFGEQNFRNIFTLKRYDKNINRQFMDEGLATFNTGFEYVVCYAKSDKFRFKPIFREASEERKSKGYWKGFWNDADRPTMRYDILGFKPDTGQWKWSEAKALDGIENYKTYLEKYSQNLTLEQYWEKSGKTLKFIKRNIEGRGKNCGVEHWIPPSDGVLRNTNWQDHFASKATESVKGLFDFPKNTDALELMQSVVYSEDAIILDFFAGSGSTAEAMFKHNLKEGLNRRFILIQLDEETDPKSNASKEGFKSIPEISKTRIRRAGKLLKEANVNKEGVDNLDIGFRVFKIDSSNMKNVNLSPDETKPDILSALESNIESDRTGEDLLFQVLLDWGVDLSLPIEKHSIDGKTVFFVDDNALAACFDEGINEDFVKNLAAKKPLRVVFRDDGFASDSVKINVEQIFKLKSPFTDIRVI
jgi:adenine-specific DNA-methyltransferase